MFPPRWVGSFSSKNSRKYEITFNIYGQQIAAFFDFAGIVGRHATVTFHPVITTQLPGGRFRENANHLVPLAAPHPAFFAIVNRQFNAALQPVFDTYWLPWSQNYDIIVGGVVWETLIYQEQWSRSTVLQPLIQHNLLNDDQDDDDDDDDLGDGGDDFNDLD